MSKITDPENAKYKNCSHCWGEGHGECMCEDPIEEAADHYVDIELVGKHIDEQLAHDAFKAGAKWKIANLVSQEIENLVKAQAAHIRALGKEKELYRELLESVPVYVTHDGVWLNFRPDHEAKIGSAMFQLTGEAAKVVSSWGLKVKAASEGLNK